MNTRLLLLISALAVPSLAEAQSPAAPLDALFACESVADSTARLACLDAAVAALHSRAEAGEVIAVNRGEVEAAEMATFGLGIPNFRLPSMARLSGSHEDANALAASEAAAGASSEHEVIRNADGNIDRIERLAIDDISYTRLDRVVITLANGQVWQQADSDSTHIPLSVSTRDTASIRSAALGSYMMRIGDRGRWFRARRTH